MLPPPVPAGRPEATTPGRQPRDPDKQRAGLAVLLVALIALLGLVALVWWINERDNDDDPFRSHVAAAAIARSPT
jgi:hypothetical protein